MAQKPKNIQELIYKSYVLSALLPLFFIEFVLLLLYFGTNHVATERYQATLLDEVEQHVMDVGAGQVERINAQLLNVSRLAQILQRQHELFFADTFLADTMATSQCQLPGPEPRFAVHANGAYYKVEDNGGAALYYTNAARLGPAERHKARCSEALDSLLKSLVSQYPLISQAYFNSWDGMVRLYPFIDDSPSVFGPDLRIQDFNFYRDADASHNPERKPVWTGAYLDPAGQGWILSAIVPIYRGDFLEGVSGLDITLDDIVADVLDMQLPWAATPLLVDAEGTILAISDLARQHLELARLPSPKSDAPITATIETPQAYSLLQSDNPLLRDQLGSFFRSGAAITQIDLQGRGYVLTQQAISETGWRLLTLTPEQQILSTVYAQRQRTLQVGFAAIALMVLFYMLFFLVLRRKSRLLARSIAEPLQDLTDLTANVEQAPLRLDFALTGIGEIDQLNRHFATMLTELEVRNQDLLESRLREMYKEQEARLLERLAETDLLTELFNRRKLDEVIGAEIERAERLGSTFGVIMLDIDHFKRVNDEYGHIAGDNVLKEFAQQLKTQRRSIDTLGRWAGEEFLLVCPGTELAGLLVLAENLRARIAEHVFPVVGSKTASFGVAEYQPGDTIQDVVNRADRALYKAKDAGRNRVESLVAGKESCQ